MPQVIIPNGQCLGAPGPAGSPVVYQFADSGDPNTKADPLGLLAGCSLGSTYQRQDGVSMTTFFYVKTGAASASAPTGVWTSK
jgi:hypothetical protein